MLKLLLLTCLLLGLCSCGQKGPLYLSKDTTNQQQQYE